MSGSNKPAAAQGRASQPKTQEEVEDHKNEQELARQKAKAEARRLRNFSRVAQMLEQESYIYNWTHPCLVVPDRNVQTEVSEFYPKLNLAIDKFYHVADFEKSLCDFKKKALAKVGIKYAYLTPDINLADIADELGVKLKIEDEDDQG